MLDLLEIDKIEKKIIQKFSNYKFDNRIKNILDRYPVRGMSVGLFNFQLDMLYNQSKLNNNNKICDMLLITKTEDISNDYIVNKVMGFDIHCYYITNFLEVLITLSKANIISLIFELKSKLLMDVSGELEVYNKFISWEFTERLWTVLYSSLFYEFKYISDSDKFKVKDWECTDDQEISMLVNDIGCNNLSFNSKWVLYNLDFLVKI